MPTKDEFNEWCRYRGYELHSRSSNDETRHYSKQFDKFFLSLSVDFPRKMMKLQGFPGIFTLSTGDLQICHPNFDAFFEKRMVQMMTAIENENETL